ncbi:hypothetical protein SADUNF_Sadunf14G0129300 [Salix dunnii]|uniref:Transmembrane protein n=1 Tax=Salix dunnii TaxID=1413687 RepID=A0A835ML26_9ROSI|nr:hypothetical protein SADUNF_Sadunf14G0129300 [Salix dunnii]
MVASTNLIISCNFSCLPLKVNPKPKSLRKNHITFLLFSNTSTRKSLNISDSVKPLHIYNNKKGVLQTCYSTLNSDNKSPDDQVLEKDATGGGKEGGRDWTTSILLFVFWGGIIYYVFNLTPDQTPSRDMYFLEKLLYLKGDDGFRMNSVLVSLWYIMGLWPLVYSMLLLPTGRSSKTNIPVWPFLILSCFGGAYALLPYFILWTPPPPSVEENELGRWPLNFLESKLTSGEMQFNSVTLQISLAAGLAIIVNAALNGGDWMEFYQYFRESKFVSVLAFVHTLLSVKAKTDAELTISILVLCAFMYCIVTVVVFVKIDANLPSSPVSQIHITCLDFTLLSAFGPFWVYNDMTARKWYDKGSWLLLISLVPFLGPALYLVLRPSLSEMPVSQSSTSSEEQ